MSEREPKKKEQKKNRKKKKPKNLGNGEAERKKQKLKPSSPLLLLLVVLLPFVNHNFFIHPFSLFRSINATLLLFCFCFLFPFLLLVSTYFVHAQEKWSCCRSFCIDFLEVDQFMLVRNVTCASTSFFFCMCRNL